MLCSCTCVIRATLGIAVLQDPEPTRTIEVLRAATLDVIPTQLPLHRIAVVHAPVADTAADTLLCSCI